MSVETVSRTPDEGGHRPDWVAREADMAEADGWPNREDEFAPPIEGDRAYELNDGQLVKIGGIATVPFRVGKFAAEVMGFRIPPVINRPQFLP